MKKIIVSKAMKFWVRVFLGIICLQVQVCINAADQFIEVEHFLDVCTKRLKSSSYHEPNLYIHVENYNDSQIVSVYLKDKHNNPKLYKIYDPNHQLMEGQNFTPKDKASGGTRKVGFYSVNGGKRPSLCFKQTPEDPIVEYAVYELYKTLFSRDQQNLPLPNSEAFLMNGKLFLMSQFMEGDSLETILKETEKNPEYGRKYSFDLESFQRLALFCLLTNPEDCRPQNCLVRKNPNSNTYQFVLIDNERNFCKDVVKGTRVHCSLFCFRELLQKEIGHYMVKRSLMKNIHEWEERCNSYSEYVQNLAAFAQTLEHQTSFKYKSPIKKLNRKLHKIHALFDKKESYFDQVGIPLTDIFRELMPKLANTYLNPEDTLSKDSHPMQLALQRIKRIDSGRSGEIAPPSSYVPLEEWQTKSHKLQRAENGSFYGEISEKTNRTKAIFVRGYYRNGAYVQGHWRS